MTNIKIARIATVSLASLLVVVGVVGEIRYQGLCTVGFWRIWETCPLGYVERSIASQEWLPQWPSLLLVVISVLLLGRVFCAWVCPTVLLRRIFGENAGPRRKREIAPKETSAANGEDGALAPKGRDLAAYSSYAVLAGVLLASFLFRFPVFCLFCPIGLFFAFIFAGIRALTPDSLGLELLIFPLMLGIELWGFKSWCRSICPVGAFLSIIGSLNRFLLPTIRQDKCLASKGVNCGACERACPEGIELNSIGKGLASNSCTKCLECYAKCPTGAIKIAILR